MITNIKEFVSGLDFKRLSEPFQTFIRDKTELTKCHVKKICVFLKIQKLINFMAIGRKK